MKQKQHEREGLVNSRREKKKTKIVVTSPKTPMFHSYRRFVEESVINRKKNHCTMQHVLNVEWNVARATIGNVYNFARI